MKCMKWMAASVLLIITGANVQAGTYTDHFDPLVADLHSREATVTDPKQLKTIGKALGVLENGNSYLLATDIKLLGKISKALARAFPEEFDSSPGSIGADLETAFQGLARDVQEIADGAQTQIDGLGVSSCMAKAKNTLNSASQLIDEANAASDFATAAKLLGSGLKLALKADAIAGNCAPSTGGGGLGNNQMRATIRGSFDADFQSIIAAASTSGGFLLVAGGNADFGGLAIALTVFNVTGPGTYPVGIGTNLGRHTPNETYFATSGTVTITTFDVANHKLVGTFEIVATQRVGSGTVAVSNGSFNINDLTGD